MTEQEKQLREDICKIARMMYDKDLGSVPVKCGICQNTLIYLL